MLGAIGGVSEKKVPYFGVLFIKDPTLLFGVLHKGPLLSETPISFRAWDLGPLVWAEASGLKVRSLGFLV